MECDDGYGWTMCKNAIFFNNAPSKCDSCRSQKTLGTNWSLRLFSPFPQNSRLFTHAAVNIATLKDSGCFILHVFVYNDIVASINVFVYLCVYILYVHCCFVFFRWRECVETRFGYLRCSFQTPDGFTSRYLCSDLTRSSSTKRSRRLRSLGKIQSSAVSWPMVVLHWGIGI